MTMSSGADSAPALPLKPEKSLPMPSVFFALGMAASYYAYPLFVSASLRLSGAFLPPSTAAVPALLLFLFAAAVCFLRTLRYIPGPNSQTVSKAGILVTAAAVGFSFGIGARRTFSERAELGFPAERITAVSGILAEDPRTLRGGSGLGVLKLISSAAPGGARASASGSVTVFFPQETIPRLKEFGRGCEIFADGTFAPGSAGSGRGFLFRASSLHVVKPASALEQFRTALRLKLLERFQARQGREQAVWGGLASALLLGVRDDLAVDLSEGFKNSGCAHVLALSGMHLAVLSGALAFLLKRPLGVRRASLAGAVFIIFYVFVAGSQPSLVRAAIMYLLGTLAVWGIVKTNPLSLLGMAFAVQLCAQSETGISYSFILSYLSLGGILTLGELLRATFKGKIPDILSGGLSASLGAFIVTAPVTALFFGSLKPVGILAGLIIAPLSSLFMVLSLAALAAGFLPLPVWTFFDYVLSFFYRILESLVSLAGQVPGFSVSNSAPVFIAALILSVFVLIIWKRDSAYRNRIASFD